MHELSLAQEIFKIATSQDQEGVPIAIGIRLGAWSCVHEDSLRNSFQWVVQNTAMHETRLVIERLQEIWYCETCQQSPESPKSSEVEKLESLSPICPWCDEPLRILDSVQEMSVDWIEYAQSDDCTLEHHEAQDNKNEQHDDE
jgi:Zn finger protein HypA/HybF involved in hydrogenase expression